ncbi:MAG: DUF4388 domain-containing protein [Chloroflexi bacterium]|uniref:DUF4388 domain-containing protein n=1 Tax=Candidatus Chlorohelix allophototropha TaxID=3003348 RepID=A0A8T7M0G7_9CHLR|nr:DUF4388 domain-containing protein [Chloroflexota bacterium]WJW67281.1 DUF4388 domain-containing protein [Chloroflexota bacterium L227-S17]
MLDKDDISGIFANGNYQNGNGKHSNGVNKADSSQTASEILSPPSQINRGQRSALTQPLSTLPLHRARYVPKNSVPAQVHSPQVVMSGSMVAFSTSALLSLLNIQKQTGMLHLYNGDTSGFIYIERGEVYDSKLDTMTGALALFQLFGWKTGDFAFEVNVPPPGRRTIQASLPVLQVRATLWLDNWNKLNPIIPTTSHRIGIASDPGTNVVIEPYHWSILTKIVNSPISMSQLASELNQDVMTVTRIAADLVKMKIAVVYPPTSEPSSEN